MQLSDERHLFGKVIFADAPQERAPMPGANLIYIYDHQSRSQRPDYFHLSPDKLLLAPVWTNRLAWTKGYFQTVENGALGESDVLRQHCFIRVARWPSEPDTLVDEFGRKRGNRVAPCSEWSLASYRWIDDHISDALGIPRVPQEEDE